MSTKKLRTLIRNGKINWICLRDQCPANCCAEVDDRLGDLLSLFDTPRHMIPLTATDARRLEKNIGNEHILQVDDGEKFIKCDDRGRCPFLDSTGSCLIYRWRGSSCRSYPFFLDKYCGIHIDQRCPGIGKGWTDLSDVLKMVEELQRVYARHFKVAKKKLESTRR